MYDFKNVYCGSVSLPECIIDIGIMFEKTFFPYWVEFKKE